MQGGVPTDLASATGVDVLTSLVTAAFGDFGPTFSASTFAGTLSWTDFQFNPLSPAPVDPLWQVIVGSAVFSFALNDVSIDTQSATELNLSGNGVLRATGYEDTFGEWTFSGDESTTVFAFSSITVAGDVVPEPGTLALLGLGLAGLAATRRERRKH